MRESPRKAILSDSDIWEKDHFFLIESKSNLHPAYIICSLNKSLLVVLNLWEQLMIHRRGVSYKKQSGGQWWVLAVSGFGLVMGALALIKHSLTNLLIPSSFHFQPPHHHHYLQQQAKPSLISKPINPMSVIALWTLDIPEDCCQNTMLWKSGYRHFNSGICHWANRRSNVSDKLFLSCS